MINLTVKTKRKIFDILAIILIILVAVVFRFTGLNWDQGHHLHPDERFLNMLVNDISLPEDFFEYLDPATSPLNPRNHGRDFYVYGNFPVTLSKIVAVLSNSKGLNKVAIVGRSLSAISDSVTVIIVFLISSLIQKYFANHKNKSVFPKKFPLWTSLVYGTLVLPIQQAHFFTSDTFLTLFSYAFVYYSLKYLLQNNSRLHEILNLIIASIFFGIAIASKITGVFFFPFIILSIFLKIFANKKSRKSRTIVKSISELLVFMIFGYLSLRLASPYLFASNNFLDPTIEPAFIENLKQLKSFEGEDVWYPPAVQWINRPITYGFSNFVIFGTGIVSSFFAIIGIINIFLFFLKWFLLFTKKVIRNKLSFSESDSSLIILMSVCLWMIGFICYYSLQFVNSVRYLYPITPFFAIIGAVGITSLLHKNEKQFLSISLVLFGLLFWPLMFLSIYLKPHSRIQASTWIYQNIPHESHLLNEHWDDVLPLHLVEYSQQYQVTQLPVFASDTETKWEEMNSLLDTADYYILSSNRAWGSISRVPEKYPQMAKFYEELFANKTKYKQVAKFSSYPSLQYLGLSISFNDSWSEEAFTVYDHPEIYIFKNSAKLVSEE